MNTDILKRSHVSVSGRGSQSLLFAHGFGCDQNMWRFVTPAFAEDYQIVLFDYVGSGQSDHAAYDPERYSSLHGYAQDVLDVCAALHLTDVIFIGHSVSSMIGLLASIQEPERFSRLVMVAPSPCYLDDPPDYHGGFERAELEGLLDLMDKNDLGWASFLAPVVVPPTGQPELMAEMEQSFCAGNPQITRRFAEVTFFSDSRPDLPNAVLPSLILQCTDDVLAPRPVGDYLLSHLPHSALHVIEASGHSPHMTHPRETVQAIKAYLSKPACQSLPVKACLTWPPVNECMDDLLDIAPCGFVLLDESGLILRVNAELCRLLACASDRLVGSPLSAVLAAGGRVFYQTHLAPQLLLHGKIEEVFLSLRSSSGADVPVLLYAARRQTAGGTVTDCIFVPIHQRLHFEADLRQARTLAEQATVEAAQASEREHLIAGQLQLALQPALPRHVLGLALTHYFEPALQLSEGVGGDFYDGFLLEDGRTALVVGDISGKGLAAASQVATVRNMLRAFVYTEPTLAGAVTKLNGVLASYLLLSGFATLFVGTYDAGTRELRCVCCGQEPALIRRAAAGAIEELEPTGPVLGAFPSAQFAEQSVLLAPGDALAIFTDGLTEVGETRSTMLGIEGVAALFAAPLPDAAGALSAPEVAEQLALRLIAGVDAAAKTGIRDDVCLLVAVATH